MKPKKQNDNNIKIINKKNKQKNKIVNTKKNNSKKVETENKTASNKSIKTQDSQNKTLKVRFLGGVGEIGKNMTALEYGKDIIVIDAGLSFPGEDMPGVDLVIPSVDYLVQNKNKVRGIIITHGHEDHIGGLPYILKDLNVPVYGTKLTLTLIENKLIERKINNAFLNCITAGSTLKLGSFNIEFINVNHSIAGAVALSITTPVGIVFHSGDFKIDYTPVGGEVIDLPRIAEIGKKGVLLLMADSTNIEIEGSTLSESVVKDTLDHVFADNLSRRLIVATFASNVHRLQQILDLAVKYKRKVAFSGRSMINIAEAASKIGELNIKDGLIVDVERVKKLKDSEVVIVSTGTQGEPMSALSRMASGEFNKVTIGENDTIVISASVIPGNEKMIYGVINNLYRLGAEVIYESLEPIHVSGHALKGELRILHSLIKPRFFIPVHGEYRHLKKHVDLAVSVGLKQNNAMICEIGDTAEFNVHGAMKRGQKFPSGSRFVDGIGIDGEDSFVLRDRKHLSEDGLIIPVVSIDAFTGSVTSVEIISKGLVLQEYNVNEIRANLTNVISQTDVKKFQTEAELSTLVRKTVKNYVYKNVKKNPMIVPIVTVV